MAPKSKTVLHPVHGYKIKPTEDLKTIKRNERERNRVQTVNRGFEILRQNIPSAAPVKKMSKIHILNHAVGYIQYLHQLLQSSQYVKTESEVVEPHYMNQYHPYYGYQTPMTPTTPNSNASYFESDCDTSGVYSDYSLHSPAASTPTSSTFSWTASAHEYTSYNPQSYSVPEVSSTTQPQAYGQSRRKADDDSQSSGDEEDIIEAIAEWQHA